MAASRRAGPIRSATAPSRNRPAINVPQYTDTIALAIASEAPRVAISRLAIHRPAPASTAL